ncbi:MAG TPA: hypothetical protein DCZ91_15230 [Lachnospiraceae bacterium]|nr:hypothetical protein [Lachnospiraceae bacterium]
MGASVTQNQNTVYNVSTSIRKYLQHKHIFRQFLISKEVSTNNRCRFLAIFIGFPGFFPSKL